MDAITHNFPPIVTSYLVLRRRGVSLTVNIGAGRTFGCWPDLGSGGSYSAHGRDSVPKLGLTRVLPAIFAFPTFGQFLRPDIRFAPDSPRYILPAAAKPAAAYVPARHTPMAARGPTQNHISAARDVPPWLVAALEKSMDIRWVCPCSSRETCILQTIAASTSHRRAFIPSKTRRLGMLSRLQNPSIISIIRAQLQDKVSGVNVTADNTVGRLPPETSLFMRGNDPHTRHGVSGQVSPTNLTTAQLQDNYNTTTAQLQHNRSATPRHPSHMDMDVYAGYHPGKVDKFALRATRKVKKGEEYPQEVSYDTMTAARDKLRVMVVTGIVVVAGLGAVWFIKKGKAERDHGDTLSKRNLARKEQWDAEKKAAETEAAAK
ncbi:hypothetical protein Bbelb_327850 [Branchiostoma belcheri]|nr:hypothetical protein Bbelb_327850 [Branchiostoma belcheri]